jgi:hypothetical protein
LKYSTLYILNPVFKLIFETNPSIELTTREYILSRHNILLISLVCNYSNDFYDFDIELYYITAPADVARYI